MLVSAHEYRGRSANIAIYDISKKKAANQIYTTGEVFGSIDFSALDEELTIYSKKMYISVTALTIRDGVFSEFCLLMNKLLIISS